MLFHTKQPAVYDGIKKIFSPADLRRLLLPLIVEQTLTITVGLVDSLMVSTLGEAAGSAVSLIDGFNVVIISVFAALATGGTVVVSQFIGAGKKSEANRSAAQLLFVCALLSLVVTAVSLVFNRNIISLCYGKIASDVMKNARTYFYITALSFPFLAIYNCSAALFRADGNSKISMKVSLCANLINILGNALLIYGFKMGVAGAAYATLAARACSGIFLFIRITNPKNSIRAHFDRTFRPQGAVIKRILTIGIPAGIENTMFQLGRLIVVVFITDFGTGQLAANSVALSLDCLGTNVGVACGLGMLTVAGQCVGTGDTSTFRYYVIKMMKISYTLNFAMNMLIFATIPITTSFYHYSESTLLLASKLIMIYTVAAAILWPAGFILPHALRAANDVRFTMVVAVSSMFLFRVGLGFLLCKVLGFGALGIWYAMIVDWIARVVIYVLRYRSGKWKKTMLE